MVNTVGSNVGSNLSGLTYAQILLISCILNVFLARCKALGGSSWVLLHFWQIPYTSMRCPFGLNFVAAATLFAISLVVRSSKSVMLPH
jgi:hypothetical protein